VLTANYRRFQKTRAITLSCGIIKISAVCSFVSSQSMNVIDRVTTAIHASMSRGKNHYIELKLASRVCQVCSTVSVQNTRYND